MANLKDSACSFSGDTSYKNEKLVYPAATRNKEPILQVLKRFVIVEDDEQPLFLEIASGSGQHVAHFAPCFPTVTFQPSEFDENLLGSISHYAKNCPSKNILGPIAIDITKELSTYGFKPNSIDYIYCANMIHISPYECTIGLFENAGMYLKPDALMITYGPYAQNGTITPQSNVDFHESLLSRNASWGLRDIKDLTTLAEQNRLTLIDTIEMPSNNKSLIWKKNEV